MSSEKVTAAEINACVARFGDIEFINDLVHTAHKAKLCGVDGPEEQKDMKLCSTIARMAAHIVTLERRLA